LAAQAKKDLESIFDSYIGPLPHSFDFEGTHYATPIEFAERNLPEIQDTFTRVSLRREALPEALDKIKPASGSNTVVGTGDAVKNLVVPLNEIETIIIDALKQKKSVPISTEMAREFIDKESGIMSIAAFNTPKGFSPVPRSYRSAFNIQGGAHQMEIVGVDVDAAGRVIKYKIKNSWGDAAGDHGYYHMYSDYFFHYLMFIVAP
jgi:bleomycin hydrolase